MLTTPFFVSTGMFMVYKAQRNRCGCHPETCGCKDYAVVDEDGNKVATYMSFIDADADAELRNSNAELRKEIERLEKELARIYGEETKHDR